MTIFFEDYYNTGIGKEYIGYGGEEVGFFEGMSQAFETQVYSGNIDTYNVLMGEALQPLIDTIKEREDIKFQQPADYFGTSATPGHMDAMRDYHVDKLFAHLNENRELYPEFAELTQESLHQGIIDRAISTMEKGRDSSERETLMGTVGGFVGNAGAVLTDDAFFEMLVMTGPMALVRRGAARTGASGMARTMLSEAIIGAGTEVFLQAGVKEWYETLGIEYSNEQFLTNVAAGGIIGAALPPVFSGAGAGVRMTTGQVKKGIEAFRGKGIKETDADIILDQLDDVAEVAAIPESTVMEQTFLPDAPEFVQPLRTKAEEGLIEDVIDDMKLGQPFNTLDELYDAAPLVQGKLEQSGRTIAKDLDVEFKTPGIKKKETSAEKINRKGYDSPKQLADVVRAGFKVKNAKQADQVVVELSKTFEVLDEGWQVTPAGYFDRKVVIKDQDGVLGEVQIWSPELLKAKETKGHKVYEKARSEKDPAKQAELNKQQQEIYAEALAQEGESFKNLFGILNDPKRLENLRMKTSGSDTTLPVVKTSRASTETQSEPGVSMATASVPDELTTAGRPSQDVKKDLDIETPSAPIIEEEAFDVESFMKRLNKADDATVNLEHGNLPGDEVGTTQTRPAPQETTIEPKDADDFVDQVAKDTDFDNMADDEMLMFDEIIDDQVVTREMSGKQVKEDLSQVQQMLDRLRGCVI